VGTIIKLADALNLETVAEGVENEDQAAVLLQLGCSRAQGWLWSQAVEAADVPRLLPA
jgi:EAL domain-containing protein (putative c-di-GMP-specific phosphodiesterase class I)